MMGLALQHRQDKVRTLNRTGVTKLKYRSLEQQAAGDVRVRFYGAS